jgi:hypothetical protein
VLYRTSGSSAGNRLTLSAKLSQLPRQAPSAPPTLRRLAPKVCGLLNQAGLGAVPRQQFRLALGDVSKLAFKCSRDVSMKCSSRLAQQHAIGRVLHQDMLEQVGRMRRYTLPELQAGVKETVGSRASRETLRCGS